MLKFLKNQGLSKLAFGFIAIATFILGIWWAFYASLAIFIYVNFTALLNVSGISEWWTNFWSKTNKE